MLTERSQGATEKDAVAAVQAPLAGPGVIKIALMQAVPAGDHQQQNWQIAERFCRQAAQEGADILLMPEMWNIGYQGLASMDAESVRQWRAQSIRTEGKWIERFRDLARELKLAIAVTYLQEWDNAPRNCVSLIDRHGKIALTYAKVHTCDFAFEAALTPGEEWPVVALDTAQGSIHVGAMICFDREFPESMRSLMLGGAEVVLVPNACPLDQLRLAQLQVRAYENATAVAIANYPQPLHNGNSSAFDAAGQPLVRGQASEGLYTAHVNVPALRAHRETTIWGNAWRRPHRYDLLTQSIDVDVFRRKNAFSQPFIPNQR